MMRRGGEQKRLVSSEIKIHHDAKRLRRREDGGSMYHDRKERGRQGEAVIVYHDRKMIVRLAPLGGCQDENEAP